MKGMLIPRSWPYEAIAWQPELPGNHLHLSVFKRRRSYEHTGWIALVGNLSEDINMIEGN